MKIDKKKLPFFKHELLDEIEKHCDIRAFAKGTEILREEQYIKVLPIVLDGLVKVYSHFDEKELLLYYIEPSQSCVMTFYSALSNAPSRICAVTEEDSQILLIPAQLLPKWLKEYPDFNELFYNLFNIRYIELLDTIKHLLLNKMDKRLYEHLKKKAQLINNVHLKMSHMQIANELGTAREVVSRVLKKLENDGKIEQSDKGIKIIDTL